MALKISVSFSQLHMTVSSQQIASLNLSANTSTLLDFVDLQTSLQFVNLVLADVRLDPDSKNLFFVGDSANALSISLTDSPALSFSTSKTDTLSISEESVFAFTSVQADTVGISESFSKVMSFVRAFSDTPTLTDSPAIAFETSASDSFNFADAPSLGIEPSKSDTFTFSDSEVLSIDPAKSDTLSVSDSPALSSNIPQSDTTTISESDIKTVTKVVPGGGTTTYTVTVASGTNSYGSGNKYYIDGSVSPALNFDVGRTYRFDVSDSSVSGHPFRFSETSNGTHGGGSAYTTNVTVNGTAGSSGAYVEIQVTASTPASLHYYCTNHSGMGGSITSSNPETLSLSESLARVVTYTRSFSDAYALDDVASPSDDLRTDFGINKGNVVGISESLDYAYETSKSDTTSLTDSPSIAYSTSFADSITISESLQSDALGIYSDSTSLSESHAIALGLTIPPDPTTVESASLTDQEVISFSKGLSDTASITESISVSLISGVTSSVLNTQALNESVLN